MEILKPNDSLRNVKITRNYTMYAEGSVLIEMGNTKVICTASVEDRVPPFKKDTGEGWVTAEYSMLPRATQTRKQRDISRLKLDGRSGEIQRLIGRSLRSVVNYRALGERLITVDCDVIQADGGTRTASITGGYIALFDACKNLKDKGLIEEIPLSDFLAAVSVGIVKGQPVLDLYYELDSCADVDMNIVMTGSGKLVEIQGTAEKIPFDRRQMNELLDLAEKGIGELTAIQKECLGEDAQLVGRVSLDEESRCSNQE